MHTVPYYESLDGVQAYHNQYQKVFSVMVVIFCFVMVVIRLAPVQFATAVGLLDKMRSGDCQHNMVTSPRICTDLDLTNVGAVALSSIQ